MDFRGEAGVMCFIEYKARSACDFEFGIRRVLGWGEIFKLYCSLQRACCTCPS